MVLAKKDENKKGRKFIYPDSFILVIGYIRIYFLPYRQTQGIIKATGRNLSNHPSYGHICKRINKLNDDSSNIHSNKFKMGDNDLIIAIDSAGIKIINRSRWMIDNWDIQQKKKKKKKKGYVKIYVAVNIKTNKEILALEVTEDEKVHDGKQMKALVEHVLERNKNKNYKITTAVLADDGACDSNENFKYLNEKGILPEIKIRKNSIISTKNNKVRNSKVRSQTRDLLKWKKKKKYGQRWMAETVFSCINRMFGEYISATRFQNMVKEVTIKISLYNLFRMI